ncbi:ADP-ribosylation factor-like protein 6-interacting protein 4 [Thalassophryne amazonica]|uniref:ADP-ribosylation factor-like protein 6-interacting protein 4 n=1 Tax=Thalassophryne amazonica TaxID=390379 RepID=UPI0014723DA6|nr:ADP-ribosylation factor-like protein 6-interacting protein 4 [Thalassophryne amazonica]
MDRSRSRDRSGREKKHDKKKKRRRSSSSSSSRTPDLKLQRKKRKRTPSSSSSSSSSSSPSSSSSSSSDEKTTRKKSKAKKRKLKKKKLKKQRKKEKKKEKRREKEEKKKAEALRARGSEEKAAPFLQVWQADDGAGELGPVMTDEQKARLSTKRPLTKEEYEARQSVIRRVVDPETGRTRLMRGEGEIIEEIVSREKHREINKQATRGDADAFQRKLGLNRQKM